MSRETYAESQIPTGVADVPYADQTKVARGYLKHSPECFIGQVTGAGGVGGELTGVPFEPAIVEVLNQAGAVPAYHKSIFASSGAVHATIAAATAANATPPVLTQVDENDWTVALPVGMLPNAEVATVIVWGVRSVGGSL